jgi:uncharacterized membrane protein
MNKNRLEAFSDGVLAIIITIMILEIKVPTGADFKSLQKLFPVFISYVLSFINVGIYWNNHHHMLQSTSRINGKILWANLHMLFWLSLIPFATNWMGENSFAKATMSLYGIVLFMAGLSYWLLQNQIIKIQGKNSILLKAIGKDVKSKVSLVLYFMAIVFSFFQEWISGTIYVLVSLLWLVPDKRIEKGFEKTDFNQD